MLFLIEYDRGRGEIVHLQRFSDDQRETAEDVRLNLELRLNREQIDAEVVLLEATTEEALRRTHRRYFENLSELVGTPPGGNSIIPAK